MTRIHSDRRRRFVAAASLAVLASFLTFGASASATEILFYSSVPRNLTEALVKAFQAKRPDVTVKIFQAGTETVLEKLELEVRGKGAPEADVVWVQEQSAMTRFADRGLFMAYNPAGAEQIDAKYKDPQGRWIGTFVTHVLLMYNQKAFDGQKAPQSWAELTDPRFRNKITLANPRVSGTGAALVSAFVQNFGWGYVEKLAANRPQIASGHPAMVSTVIAGERTVGPMQDLSIFDAMAKKQPIAFTFPSEGAVAVPAFAAINAKTGKVVESRALVDFFVSQDAATVLRSNGMYHTRADALPPEGWPSISEIKTLAFDWAKHQAEKEQIKDKFSDLVER